MSSEAHWTEWDPVVLAPLAQVEKREPVQSMHSPMAEYEPLNWSEDHRLSVSTSRSITVLELTSEIQSSSADLDLKRSYIALDAFPYEFQVGPEDDVKEAKKKLETNPDPMVRQLFLMDLIMNPQMDPVPGVKMVSWSPSGCDVNGRCILACLTTDCRLTLHYSPKHLRWSKLLDLTVLYGNTLKSKNYPKGRDIPAGDLNDPEELKRRYYMQAASHIQWSFLCTTREVDDKHESKESNTVMLAVMMENTDVIIWHFRVPILGASSLINYKIIRGCLPSASTLAWWRYEQGGQKVSGIIVGSAVGCVTILPFNMKAVTGYFTIKTNVVLWPMDDQIPVTTIKSLPLYHPHLKCNTSLILVVRGQYLLWSLMLATNVGLTIHNAHVTNLHTMPITALSTSQHEGAIYTSSMDGSVKKLTVVFTDTSVSFKQQEVILPEGLCGGQFQGISVSPNGAYLALGFTEGLQNGFHPVTRSYQVQLLALKTPDEAAALLLESQVLNLYKQTDLLDLVRWQVLLDKCISPFLQAELDRRVHATSSAYLWRFKIFVLRALYKSMQRVPVEARWRPAQQGGNILLANREAGVGDNSFALGEPRQGEAQKLFTSEQRREVRVMIQQAETHLTREHMKKVLGDMYLHTAVPAGTSVPTRGLCDFLLSDLTIDDRASEVVVGHVLKKINRQRFPEYCSLCGEEMPFTDYKRAECSNGHIWLRCLRSFQACQNVHYRRCINMDSIATLPRPDDPEWVLNIMKGPCTYCDAPLL